MTVPLLQHEGGKTPQRIGLAHPSISPYGVFASRDGAQILISIQNEREWRMFCRDVLRDEAVADEAVERRVDLPDVERPGAAGASLELAAQLGAVLLPLGEQRHEP